MVAMSTPTTLTELANALMRMDGWQNLFTNLGIQGKDPNQSSSFVGRAPLPMTECKALYEQNWQAARAVDALSEDAVKAWFSLEVEDDTDAADVEADDTDDEDDGEGKAKTSKSKKKGKDHKGTDLSAALAKDHKRLKAKAAFKKAAIWSQVFGGAVILVGADDGQADWSQPLSLATVKRVRYLHVVDRRYAIPEGPYDLDDQSPNYGNPLLYLIQPTGQGGTTRLAHWTRILRFEGSPVSAEQQVSNQSWGNSVFERFHEPLKHLQTVLGATATACQSFSQGVLSIQDLESLLGSEQEVKIVARILAFKMGLSMANLAMIDGQREKYERVGQPVTGLKELIDAFQLEATGATRTPQSKTYGAQEGRLAGSTEDTKTWDGRVAAYQEEAILPQLERLTEICLAAKEGPLKGAAPPAWCLKANPLTPPDLDKEIERRLKQVQIDKGYFEMEALEASEARKSRFGGPSYSHETTLDPDITSRLEEAERAEPTEPEIPETVDPNAEADAPGQGVEQGGQADPGGGRTGPDGKPIAKPVAGAAPKRPPPGGPGRRPAA